MENYSVNADLLRFCKDLSILEWVERRFVRNLITSNIIANYI